MEGSGKKGGAATGFGGEGEYGGSGEQGEVMWSCGHVHVCSWNAASHKFGGLGGPAYREVGGMKSSPQTCLPAGR